MIELKEQDYYKASESLKKVTYNSLFARAVIEGRVTGKVYADSQNEPNTFYVIHPYGMTLLFGSNKNQDFNLAFKNKSGSRDTFEWMQAYPNDWDNTLRELYGNTLIKFSDNRDNCNTGIIELNTRVNFQFNPQKYFEFKKDLKPLNGTIIRTSEREFNEMTGSVIPSNFWDNAVDFLTNGIGFSHYFNGQLSCTAYSAFLIDNMLELGMETLPKFRGKGIALHTCSRLIDYCLENNLEPIWACRLENIGSFNLAKKLGFEPTVQIPYYRLSK
ncbi:MAG: GNAT family N-acetyltransferase [Flagellimonas sp.]